MRVEISGRVTTSHCLVGSPSTLLPVKSSEVREFICYLEFTPPRHDARQTPLSLKIHQGNSLGRAHGGRSGGASINRLFSRGYLTSFELSNC